MQKVYLLLRNSHQSGPYTIGELLQQQVRPTDMVWIEGKSTAWAYVSELELQPSIQDVAEEEYAADDIESKAEALRKKVLAYTPPAFHTDRTEVVKHILVPESQNELEEIDFIDHRKKPPSIVGEIMMTLVIVGFIFGGMYGGQKLFMGQQKQQNSVATKISTTDNHTASGEQPVVNTRQEDSISVVPVQDTTTTIAYVPEQPKKTVSSSLKKRDSTHIDAPVVAQNTNPDTITKTVAVVPEKNERANETVAAETKEAAVTQPEKKRGFLKNLFKKKKKEGDTVENDSESNKGE